MENDMVDIELYSERIHDIWMIWANHMMSVEQISDERKMRWKSLMIPYKDLSEIEKEKDRVVVRYVLQGKN